MNKEVIKAMNKKETIFTKIHKWWGKNDYKVYIPIKFEHIRKSGFISNFKNPQLEAPEYYFNPEQTSYTYGYDSMENLYNDVIKPLESDYKISEK